MKELNNNVKNMFLNLKKNIGSYVTCKYWYDEKLCIKSFKLFDIKEYDYIITDDYNFISFISYNQYIISVEDDKGNILYENRIFENEFKRINNEDEFFEKEKMVFGPGFENPHEKISKTYLINKGLKLINPELENEWIYFVSNNIPIGLRVVLATISYLEKINLGMSFYEAEIAVYGDEFNLYGSETSRVDDALKLFCKNRLGYREYLNKDVIEPSINYNKKNRIISAEQRKLIRKINRKKIPNK